MVYGRTQWLAVQFIDPFAGHRLDQQIRKGPHQCVDAAAFRGDRTIAELAMGWTDGLIAHNAMGLC
jgi:hypothetical protein